MSSTKEGSAAASLQEAIKEALRPYLAPLTQEERSKVKSYELDESLYPFKKIDKDKKLQTVYQIEKFAVPCKQSGTPFLKSSYGCSFSDYYRVVSEVFLSDPSLHFLYKHILHQIDEKLREGIWFCNNVCTAHLTSYSLVTTHHSSPQQQLGRQEQYYYGSTMTNYPIGQANHSFLSSPNQFLSVGHGSSRYNASWNSK